MTSLKIKVTKAILEKSKMCGHEELNIAANCAISLAIRDIFPNAQTAHRIIYFSDNDLFGTFLPAQATDFIFLFDRSTPEERPSLPEIEFEISIPDEVINTINLDELAPLLENHPTLQLIYQ